MIEREATWIKRIGSSGRTWRSKASSKFAGRALQRSTPGEGRGANMDVLRVTSTRAVML